MGGHVSAVAVAVVAVMQAALGGGVETHVAARVGPLVVLIRQHCADEAGAAAGTRVQGR